MTPLLASALVVGIALWVDLRRRRIPNWLTLSAALAALAYHGPGPGEGLGFALAGLGLGLALLLPGFLLGGVGGGDVKLLAALGAWLGSLGSLWLFAWTALAGAALVAGVLVLRRRAPDLRGVRDDLVVFAATRRRLTPRAESVAIPYALAVGFGLAGLYLGGGPLQ